jgi:DNA primase
MKYAIPTRGCFAFRRDLLPAPSDYYAAQGLKLIGRGAWRDAVCPFHEDTRPSLRVRIDTGAFRCMVCGAHGRDVLAFHMRRFDLRFVEAVKALGAWGGGQ